MEIADTIAQVRTAIRERRQAGLRVGLVPTMGFLHNGHVALIRESTTSCDVTVVSIFVNPTQFGPNEDLSTYPRDLGRDERTCIDAGVNILFLPTAAEIYPEEFQTFIEPGRLAEPLCGAVRPGHFRGVATVVAKLLNIVQPDAAFFGQKDYQQVAVVRRMVRDLDMPVEIVTVPTVREADGLAMSSRNAYLSVSQRERATCISRGLLAAQAAFRGGEHDASKLVAIAGAEMVDIDSLQYLELRDAETLEPVIGSVTRSAVLLAAAFIGSTRLIDNVIL
ncbi:pantoate--beta-alanine ligase [Microvirga massiliensis]|uniref:pantoate--beta-alanine ligase n=1 Tax=Microvirga massiliensis TaxID=1033741 RepID=UPI00062B4DC9|nr:pantoate--beta-alanine ligase [Microvirga massiliensis]